MSIDKSIEKLAHERQCFIDECYQNDGELEAYDMAISTMRKYQKIEEIVENTQQLCSYGSAFIDIREVIEDGNDSR